MLSARSERDLGRAVRVWVALAAGEGLGPAPAPAPASPPPFLTGPGQVTRFGSFEKPDPAVERRARAALAARPGDVLSVLVGVVGHRLALRAVGEEKSLFWGSEERGLEGRREGMRAEGGGGLGLEVEGVVREVAGVV